MFSLTIIECDMHSKFENIKNIHCIRDIRTYAVLQCNLKLLQTVVYHMTLSEELSYCVVMFKNYRSVYHHYHHSFSCPWLRGQVLDIHLQCS